MKFIIGKKLGMTTIFDVDKGALNITLIECGKNTVSLLRTKEKNGYSAIQFAMPKTKKKTVKVEFRLDKKIDELEINKTLTETIVGTDVKVGIFQVGDVVNIIGTTKAKGFQGVVKRHGFKGAHNASHGQAHDSRKGGSIGMRFPQHVVKGRKMPGRTGGKRHTTQNLKVVFVDENKNLIGVRGAVPGVTGRIVQVYSV